MFMGIRRYFTYIMTVS